jgi:glycosyltransferase involved in cell wall biosynthesis
MRISIVTPWAGSTASGPNSLLPDYANACQHADEIVTVNNACDHTTSTMLAQFHEQGGTLLVNAENAGFAAGNNQGYARATGDVIIFLNSDIAADPRWLECVRADVKEGSLYGPSLQHQLVAGRWLPYIEGWCIAATRGTWERITETLFSSVPTGLITLPDDMTQEELERIRQELKDFYGRNRGVLVTLPNAGVEVRLLAAPGPWDADAYSTPYWEDNDLALRALQLGISLIPTTWPIQHKGGATAGPIAKYGRSFAQNERTFTDRVLQALSDEIAPTPTWAKYQQFCATQSDIQHHLPLLYSLARGNVLELGTRGGVSTAALLAGVEAHGGKVFSVDIDDCGTLFPDHPLWSFIQHDSRAADAIMRMHVGEDVRFSLALVDTIHTVEHVEFELARWASYMAPGGTICVHDTETFPGVRRAVREFCQGKGWGVTFVLPCNGMAVIEVPNV